MKTFLISMAIGALFLAPCAVSADVPAMPKPPKKVVIDGTLSWEEKIEKKRLKLAWKNGVIFILGPAEKITETNTGKPIVPEGYIGKQVTMTLKGRPPSSLPPLKFLLSDHPCVSHIEGLIISLTLAKGR